MAKVVIPVGLDDSEVKKGLADLRKGFKNSATQWNASLEIAQKGFQLLAAAGKIALDVIVESVKLANEQVRVERRVLAAIRLRGTFTDANFEALQKFNSALQQRLGFGDEELLQLQGTFAALGLNTDQLEAATKATIGLAEATGQKLQKAGKLVARALLGDVAALKTYGIVANDAADATAQLNELFKIAEAQSDTLETKINVLTANFGDLQEELGKTVLESEEVREIFDELNFQVLKGADLIKDNKDEIIGFIDNTATAITTLARASNRAAELIKASGIVDLLDFFDEFEIPVTLLAPLPGATLIEQLFGGVADAVGLLGEETVTVEQLALPLDPATGAEVGAGVFGPREDPRNAERRRRKKERERKRAARKAKAFKEAKFDPGAAPDVFFGEGTGTAADQLELEQLLKSSELKDDLARKDLEKDKAIKAEQLKQLQEHFDNLQDITEENNRAIAKLELDLVNIGAKGFGDFFKGLGAALVSGNLEIDALLGKFLGSIVGQLGTVLVGIGTAGIAAGILGTVAPIFRAAGIGGPESIAASVGLIAAGGTLQGIGAALGASVGGGGGGRKSAGGSASRAPGGPRGVSEALDRATGGDVPTGFVKETTGGPAVNNITLNFGRGFIVGSPAKVGREMLENIRAAQRLSGAAGGM